VRSVQFSIESFSRETRPSILYGKDVRPGHLTISSSRREVARRQMDCGRQVSSRSEVIFPNLISVT
jgi:hypothetical protein